MSDSGVRPVRRRFAEGTTIEDLKAYMGPFAATLGYVFNTETDFVDEVLRSELEILEATGDVYCPCRVRTGDPKED
ncbi:MAG: ferredoxin-thioredoxin reductase catalytic domain-containing protein, partial [Coriobacteriia bacterium]|nr:ferredoxin-thioredoxin reductase catalytic domain-containing protein [Coriobacteriia bacterium]